MSTLLIHCPSKLEQLLFDAGLVNKVSLAQIYDIKAGTSIQQSWQNVEFCMAEPDIHKPENWDDKLHASLRGEFFVDALDGCKKILDIGCGEGYPALYLASRIPEVSAIDISPKHIELARNTARLMGLTNIDFAVGSIEHLPFDSQSFGGVCFAGNVFTYGFDLMTMLREVHHVLQKDSVFAFEQRPGLPSQDAWERIMWFIDGGPPILHYAAGKGVYSRTYFIIFKEHSKPGKSLTELATRMAGELSDEQRLACEEIKQDLENGNLEDVERALYSGEDRALASDELLIALHEAGFSEFTSWLLPDAVEFARSLEHNGLLHRLQQSDLIPMLKALVSSASRYTTWQSPFVTCVKI